jgi:hypothetical protein
LYPGGAEQLLELAPADAGIAALDDRIGESLGQVTHQRAVAVVGLDADDVHEPADDLDSRLGAEGLRVPGKFGARGILRDHGVQRIVRAAGWCPQR